MLPPRTPMVGTVALRYYRRKSTSDHSTLSQISVQAQFEQIYEQYGERITTWLARRLNDREQALELSNEVFLRVWQSLPRWQERGVDSRAWLYRIARARLIDVYRRRRVVESSLDDYLSNSLTDPAETERDAIEEDLFDRLRFCISLLPPDQREVIEFRFLQDLSYREIAEQTGKNEATLRSLTHRGIARLKELAQRGTLEQPLEQLSLF